MNHAQRTSLDIIEHRNLQCVGVLHLSSRLDHSKLISRPRYKFTMTAVSNYLVLPKNPRLHLSSGSSLKPSDRCLGSCGLANLSFSSNRLCKVQLSTSRRNLTVQAAYSDGQSNSAGIFIGGFVLGGIIVGTLGCVYAPQISKALAGAAADRKDLMRKLPKFIYDEEKALEKTRKILAEKIAQLSSAIDDVSTQLHAEDESPDGVAVNSDEIEATV
ncbi:uncharacterized protein LOC123202635 [Mangifera indica]|uniref:uncharacterized protein LOC123202635 n=1 Tax=Mangifera indica TaxID=29780 RepID=UPI001CF9A530|nr:uncharacterized protein LOC123202635 [Mangifera indica]